MHNYKGIYKPKGRFFWFVVCFRCVDILLFAPKQTKSYYVCTGNVVWGWRWR